MAILLLTSLVGFSQTRDTFYLRTIPTYDEFGNLYHIVKSFNHIPTKQDSIKFQRESDLQLRLWMDSMRMYYAPKGKVKQKLKKSK